MNYKMDKIYVLVPARNEQLLLKKGLNSIIQAADFITTEVHIILCVDASTDDTLKIGEQILKDRGTVICSQAANVGYSRRYAADTALKLYTGRLEHCWLANTDADCIVPRDWLQIQLELAERHIECVAGIVQLDNTSEVDSKLNQLFNNTYSLFEDGTHPHVHAANFGIRADVYKKAGGWNPLETAEEHEFWKRLDKMKVHKAAISQLMVYTSARKVGRAPNGFAKTLSSLRENPL